MTSTAGTADNAQVREYERMRAALNYAIADEKAYTADVFVPTRRGAATPKPSPTDAAADFAIYRQRYQTIQQAMDTNIAKLRSSLRAALTAQTPARARLAMVDAILERSLSIQERRLFATVPSLLEKHFQRLRETAQQAEKDAEARSAQSMNTDAATPDLPAGADAASPATSTAAAAQAADPTAPAVQQPTRAVPLANTRFAAHPRASKPVAPVVPLWLATFRKDLRSVMLAELDIRLQPIEGLMAALRDR